MDDLEEILRASRPVVRVGGCEDAAREIATSVAGSSRRRPKHRQRRFLVAAAAGVVLIPGVAAAAMLHFKAETGHYGLPGMTENDTSQYINMCASGIQNYVKTLEPVGRPLPPGTRWDDIAHKLVVTSQANNVCPPKGPGMERDVTGIKGGLLEMSTCPWEKWALSAPPSSQTADVRRADDALASIQVGLHRLGATDSGWKQAAQRYSHASRAFLDYDYQVNCLGRNTASNPPTVPDPNQ